MDLTVMLSCGSHSGVVSFTDIEVAPDIGLFRVINHSDSNSIPKFPSYSVYSNFLSAESVVASCARDAVTSQEKVVQPNFIHINWTADELDGCHKEQLVGKITIGVHVEFDKITSLETGINNWAGIVSLAIFVPVTSLNEGLTKWQRFVMGLQSSDIEFQSHCQQRISGQETEELVFCKMLTRHLCFGRGNRNT